MKASLSMSGILLTRFIPPLLPLLCVCVSFNFPFHVDQWQPSVYPNHCKPDWRLIWMHMPNGHDSFWHSFSNGINISISSLAQMPEIAFNRISSLHIKHISVSSAFVRAFKQMFCFEFMINDELSMFTLNRPFVEQAHNAQSYKRQPSSPIQASFDCIYVFHGSEISGDFAFNVLRPTAAKWKAA